jgi:hypothetical protein
VAQAAIPRLVTSGKTRNQVIEAASAVAPVSVDSKVGNRPVFALLWAVFGPAPACMIFYQGQLNRGWS